jgi:hypothetical protein
MATSQSSLFDPIGKVPDLAPVIGYLHKVPTLSPRCPALLLPEPLPNASKHGNSSTQDYGSVSILAEGYTPPIVADHQSKSVPRTCSASLQFRSIPLISANKQKLHCKKSYLGSMNSGCF